MQREIVNLIVLLLLTIGTLNTIPSNEVSYKDVDVESKSDEIVTLPKETGSTELLVENLVDATPEFGELIDWKDAQILIPNNSIIRVVDLNTRKSFNIKRTFGTNHLDGEAVTLADSDIIKSIWNGFSWTRRPVIVSINNKHIAASMSAMPHAGVDSAPAVAVVKSRSDGYGTGENLDAVKDNGMDGVIDIHFYNSKHHKDNKPDPMHAEAILKAAGQ